MGLPRNSSCSTEGDSVTKLHSKFLSVAVASIPPPNTFGTYLLVFTKLLSLVRCVPQREPIENYIFVQNFQLVKRHQHLHQLEKSNGGLYKTLLGLVHVQAQILHVICVSQLHLQQKAVGLLHFAFTVKSNYTSPSCF